MTSFADLLNQSLNNQTELLKQASQITFLLYQKADSLHPKIILNGKFDANLQIQDAVVSKQQIVLSKVPPSQQITAPVILQSQYQSQINHLPISKYGVLFFEPYFLQLSQSSNPILGSIKPDRNGIYLNTYTQAKLPNLPNFPRLNANFKCDGYQSVFCVNGHSLAYRLRALNPKLDNLIQKTLPQLSISEVQQLVDSFKHTYQFSLSHDGSFQLYLSELNFNTSLSLLQKILSHFRLHSDTVQLTDGSKVKRLNHTVKGPEYQNKSKAIFNLSKQYGTVLVQDLQEENYVKITYQPQVLTNQKNTTPLSFNPDLLRIADEVVLLKPQVLWPTLFQKLKLQKDLNLALISNTFDDGIQTLIKLSW